MNVNVWNIVATTDMMTKVVLLLLLVMSVISWAVAVYKKMAIAAKIKSLSQACSLLKNTKSMDDFIGRLSVMQNTYAGDLVAQFLSDYKKVLSVSDGNSLSTADWQMVQNSIMQRIDEELVQEEFLVPILSTQAQAAPLIGLFGTVWGLIHSFMGIAEQKSADIAAVAPGIAEALITTMGGLVVAIPALVLFNYINGQVKKFESQLLELSDTYFWIIRTVMSPEKTIHDPSIRPGHKVQEL